MIEKKSYYVKYKDGSAIWFDPSKDVIEENMESKEERLMLYAEEGKVLHNKKLGLYTPCTALENAKEKANWEEVDESETPSED